MTWLGIALSSWMLAHSQGKKRVKYDCAPHFKGTLAKVAKSLWMRLH